VTSFPALPSGAAEESAGGSGATPEVKAPAQGPRPGPSAANPRAAATKPVVAARSRGRTPEKKSVFGVAGGKAALEKKGVEKSGSSVGSRVSRRSLGARGDVANLGSSVESLTWVGGGLTVPVGGKAYENFCTDLEFSGKQPRPDRQFCTPRYTAVPPPARGCDHPLDTPAPKIYTYLSEGIRMSVESCNVEVDDEGELWALAEQVEINPSMFGSQSECDDIISMYGDEEPDSMTSVPSFQSSSSASASRPTLTRAARKRMDLPVLEASLTINPNLQGLPIPELADTSAPVATDTAGKK
jgi:hypothetical protein